MLGASFSFCYTRGHPILIRGQDAVSNAVLHARELKFLAVGFQSKLETGDAARRAEAWMHRGNSKLARVAIRDGFFEVSELCHCNGACEGC